MTNYAKVNYMFTEKLVFYSFKMVISYGIFDWRHL